jgi:IS5 family transposase
LISIYCLNMKYRNPKKDNDLFSMINHQQEVMRTIKGINKLNAVIDWELFRVDLEILFGYDVRDLKKGGRPPSDVVLMLKVLVLQKYYALSDDEAEFQIIDRFSFMQFLDLKTGDSVPDVKTIWHFRQSLEKDGRDGRRKIVERFGKLLEGQGMLVKEGSIVDASFVAAPRQRNTREQNAQIKEGERPTEFDPNSAIGRQKNCDARWAKKNHEVSYGYKNHAKVDAKSKLVSGYATTPASVHDSQVFEELINEAVFADNAYQSEASCEYLRKRTARTSFSSRQRAVILSAKKNMQPTSYAAVSAFAVNKSSDA